MLISALHSAPPPPTRSQEAPPRRRRFARRWRILGTLVLGALWLNGPGLRWLAPLAARHFLAKAGLQGGLRVEGSLSGGFCIADVKLQGSGTLAGLTVRRATPYYQWSRLVHGHLDGLSINGVHADLCLDPKPNPDAAAKPPLDLDPLLQTLRSVRAQVVPLQLDFTDLSLSASRTGKPAFVLAPSRLSHTAGSDAITLETGTLTDPNGREWAGQTTRLEWAANHIALDKLAPLPGLGVSDLTVHLPATGGPALDAFIHLDAAVLRVETTAGFATAQITLQSGSVDLEKLAKSLDLALPATATLSALTLEAAGLMPDPTAATGRVELTLETLNYQDWQVPLAHVSAVLVDTGASLKLQGEALCAPVSLDAELALGRSGGRFVPGVATGTFHLSDVPAVMRELATRFAAIRPAADVPAAALDGSFKLAIGDNHILTADTDATLTPADPALASPLALHARWQPDQPASAELTIDGLNLNARYDISASTYQGELTFDGFSNSRIDRWLAIAGVTLGGNAELTGMWQGGGDLSKQNHHGLLTLTQGAWHQAQSPPLTATGTLRYEWPDNAAISDLKGQFGSHSITLDLLQAAWLGPQQTPWPTALTLRGVHVLTADQDLAAEATMAGGLLNLNNFTWHAGDTLIAEGSASLPVPQDFSRWRDTLANDTRPATLNLQSRVLSFALLEPWLPAAAQLDPRATAQVRLSLSGNYLAPALDASLECFNLRSPANPKIPPAALKLALTTANDRLLLNGSVSTPDYAPAVLTASMAFRPATWAASPETLQQETLTASAGLPRLDLARLTALVPAARQLTGTLTGNLLAAGNLAAPELRGALHLTNAGILFRDPALPPLQNATADLDLTLNAVTLKNLRATIAGGNLTGNGTLALTDAKPATLDFRLRGDHLPLLRNDMLILRANADLRLQGPWETAVLTGSIGAVDSLFYRDIELLPIGKPFTAPSAAALPKIDAPQAAASALPAPFDHWALNLAVRTQEPFLIRGNFATGHVDANLRLGGTLAKPQPEGTLVLTDFTAALPFSTLKVPRGTLRFTPESGFDPILELRGTAQPRPYRIDAFAYGKLSDPQLVLTSNPPLPETEIMTLLATGTTSSGLENTQAASSRAIQLFAEEIRRGRVRYTRQLRPLLGVLDRVDFSLAEADPYSSGSLSTATLNLSDRWLVSAGMGQDGTSRVMGIWRFSFR
ncbi:MAG: translocation/assembly module TamB domain-containing protein [Verrucomicrobiota bacterium]